MPIPLIRPGFGLILCIAMLAVSGPVRAKNCELFNTCCLQVVAAHEERGLRGVRLTQALQTCYVHEALSALPGTQAVFCIDSWYLVSTSAWEDFQAGRIGYYPESCDPDPTLDPDEVLAPSLEELEAEPEVEE